MHFSVTGLPAGATATFSPVAVVPGNQTAVVTMTVQTVAAAAMQRGVRGMEFAAVLGVVGLMGGRRRRKMGALALLGVGMAGCGARTVADGLSAAKTYSLVVTATSTNAAGAVVTHTLPLKLTVN